MAQKDIGGKSKREVAKEKKQKAELVDKKKAESRKKIYKAPSHRLVVSKRAKKQAQTQDIGSSGVKKGQNCQRHPLKDLLCTAKGWKDKAYPEANFRVVGKAIMRTAKEWANFRAV